MGTGSQILLLCVLWTWCPDCNHQTRCIVMSSISDASRGLKFGWFFGNSDVELSPAACQELMWPLCPVTVLSVRWQLRHPVKILLWEKLSARHRRATDKSQDLRTRVYRPEIDAHSFCRSAAMAGFLEAPDLWCKWWSCRTPKVWLCRSFWGPLYDVNLLPFADEILEIIASL